MSERFGGKRSRQSADQRDDSNPELFIINHHMEPGRIEKFVLRLKDDPEEEVGRFAAKTKMTDMAAQQLLSYALDCRQEFLQQADEGLGPGKSLEPMEMGDSPMGHLRQKGFSSKFSESMSQQKPPLNFHQMDDIQKFTVDSIVGGKPKARLDKSHSQLDKSDNNRKFDNRIGFKGFPTEPAQPISREEGQNKDDFADKIARQIEQASAMIYKAGGNPKTDKSMSHKSRPFSAKKDTSQQSDRAVRETNSRRSHDRGVHRSNRPVVAEDAKRNGEKDMTAAQEASFRSFNPKKQAADDRHTKSQVSEDAEKTFLKLYQDGLVKHSKRSKQIFDKQMREEAELRQVKIDQGKRYSSEIVDRLYYKGIVREDVKKYNNERLKSLKDVEERSQYTYHPKISRISKIIAENRDERTNLPIEDYLIIKGQTKAKYLEQASAAKLGEELIKLQDKPRISETSKILAHNRSQLDEGRPRVSKHKELFEESTQRRQRSIILQEAYNVDRDYTYQPAINDESRKIVAIKHGNQDFVERLSKYASEKDSKLMLEKARLHPPFNHIINPETNLPYFHPMTGRPPSSSRESEIMGVGAYLHSLSSKRKDKLELQREAEYDRKKREKEAIPQSSQLIEQRKNTVFKNIFESLDNDHDGVISAEKINIEVIHSDILKIISPMLINMEELTMEIDETTFTYGMHEIYKKLCVADRDRLLGGFKPKRVFVDEECTFKPSLNSSSLKLAANKRSIIETVNIATAKKKAAMQNKYELDSEGNALTMIHEENSDTRSQLNKYQEELQDCTFRPRLNDYVPLKSHYL
jgi:hypothetical protein